MSVAYLPKWVHQLAHHFKHVGHEPIIILSDFLGFEKIRQQKMVSYRGGIPRYQGIK
jgi:hypothetical protein